MSTTNAITKKLPDGPAFKDKMTQSLSNHETSDSKLDAILKLLQENKTQTRAPITSIISTNNIENRPVIDLYTMSVGELYQAIEILKSTLKSKGVNEEVSGIILLSQIIKKSQYQAESGHHELSYPSKWFRPQTPSKLEIQSFVQYCLLPRAIRSDQDALFIGEFITDTIGLELSKNFIISLVREDFIETLLYGLTPSEAQFIGSLYHKLLSHFEKLRNDDKTSNDLKKSVLDWHSKLLASIVNCFESGNHLASSNTMVLLTKLIDIFPVVEDHGEEIIDSISHCLADKSIDQRLEISLRVLLSELTNKSKNWSHLWEFYQFDQKEEAQLKDDRNTLLKERAARKIDTKRAELIKAQEEYESLIGKTINTGDQRNETPTTGNQLVLEDDYRSASKFIETLNPPIQGSATPSSTSTALTLQSTLDKLKSMHGRPNLPSTLKSTASSEIKMLFNT